jgi:hypothetical protein
MLPRTPATLWRISLCVLGALGAGCNSRSQPAPVEATDPSGTPDRLTQRERLPEAETAFGLTLPPGMELTRHFNDSAYFVGKLDVTKLLVHVKERIFPGTLEMQSGRAVFARTQVKGDESGRLLRIEVSSQGDGTVLYSQNITPPPAPKGLTEREMWTRAGRNPDGTVINENQQY